MASSPLIFTTEFFFRTELRSSFKRFEKYMDFIVKEVARNHWGPDTWLFNLKGSVGPSMKAYITIDREMDTYSICEILRKHLKLVYLPRSSSSDDYDNAEALRNAIVHISCTRNLLEHGGRPSVLEMMSCIMSILDVCSVFKDVEGNTHIGVIVELDAQLKLLELSMQQLANTAEYTGAAFSENDFAFSVVDKMLHRFETLINPFIHTCLGDEEYRDSKEICELLQNEGKSKTYKSKLTGLISPDRIREIEENMKSMDNKSFVKALRESNLLTPQQLIQIRIDAGECLLFSLSFTEYPV